jgi:NADPH-dependent glutamate synthase beta subunit-like oxidoreductase
LPLIKFNFSGINLFNVLKEFKNKYLKLLGMETSKKRWHTVIIGAGQSGLATGYFLKRMNKEFIILDKNEKIGDSWRNR